MTNYTLVCLVGDGPTKTAAEFAKWLNLRRAAQEVWLERAPPHDAVEESVRRTKAIVLLAHDGPLHGVHSLRSEAAGGVWMRGEEVGRRFAGARVYLLACETMGSESTRPQGLEFLGDEAQRAGAAVVAGHSLTLDADFERLGGPHAERFRHALAELIWGFLDGENGEQRLKLRAREELQRQDFQLELDAGDLATGSLDWFRRVQWLEDRIAGFHIAAMT